MTPAPSFSSFDKPTRVGVLTLICFLHGALFFVWRATESESPAAAPLWHPGWRGTAPDQTPIAYLNLWKVPHASPRPKFDSKEAPKSIHPSSNAQHRSTIAQLPGPQARLAEHDIQGTSAAADPRPAPISEAPLDLERLRSQARENEKRRIKSPLERLHENERAVQTVESQVAEAARRSARKDCQTAYGGLGLLALAPLLYDTVTDNGCKWK